MLLIEAIWGLDPNDSMFLESWKSICYELDKVEQEIHKPNIDFGNTEYNNTRAEDLKQKIINDYNGLNIPIVAEKFLDLIDIDLSGENDFYDFERV